MNNQNDDGMTISPAYGVDVNGVPLKQDQDISTDYQQRSEALEQLLRDTLLYLKHIALYSYSNAPRAIELLDRAAELGIVPELSPAEKHQAEIDARRKIQSSQMENYSHDRTLPFHVRSWAHWNRPNVADFAERTPFHAQSRPAHLADGSCRTSKP